jgi:CRP-like cAMP-binding protein
VSADLRRFPVFAALEDAELVLVASLLEERELAAEQRAWSEGEPAEGLWLLERGALRLEARGAGALGQCEAPAQLGAASLVGDSLRETSAFASGPVRVRVFSRTAFARLLDTAPRAAARLLVAIAVELGAVLRDAVQFSNPRRLPASQRHLD